MNIINPQSLSITLDNINEIYFYGKKISSSDKEKAAKWIASRQGLHGSYWGMFAPTDFDYKNGHILFTGEKITSGAGISHFSGEEACRALALLNGKHKSITEALDKAQAGLSTAIKTARERGVNTPDGYYCCAKCSVSYWRNLSAQCNADANKLLMNGMKILNKMRDGKGKWKRFPFYYTLFALQEIDLKPAREEMKYAAPVLEKYLQRAPSDDKYNERKRMLAEKVLEKV
ncbi:MAG: hypothetical protein EHM58_03585 [Ignavibacteriae bacterium]|nr:MAG: hypothetical protein EHM58_03585 [Ignavibacteriota bacterium]